MKVRARYEDWWREVVDRGVEAGVFDVVDPG
jgi:hypothetical protein